jgi:uncharacterized membrane protein (DUF106 family)
MQISEIDRRVLGIEKKTLDEIRKEMIAHKQAEERRAVKELRDLEQEDREVRAGTFFCISFSFLFLLLYFDFIFSLGAGQSCATQGTRR